MKILFLARHFGCLRNFERSILRLAERGHQLHLAAHQDDLLDGQAMVQAWTARHPGITMGWVPEPVDGEWTRLAPRLRLMIDYLRYLEPAYRAAPALVQRAAKRTPLAVLQATASPVGRSWPIRRLLRLGLRAIERSVPVRDEAMAFLRAQAPDVVLLTPLISLGSDELDYLDAARALGLHTVFCVWSWDNLSSKSLLRATPDVVTVWNETQRREAMELHRVPRARIAVTGAQSFDEWFERAPSRSREGFCDRVGLPAERPLLVWVCSALFVGSAPEADFVVKWLRSLRAAPDRLVREASVLIRPHPSRRREWESVDLSGLGPVVLWGRNPIDEEARADYFDSLYYSAAVVGLNTSAFLEAAILEKPVLTVLLSENYENQAGTLHFRYLLEEADGLLETSTTLDAHVAQLGAVLRDPGPGRARARRFAGAFIRPLGLEVEATGRFVETIERTAERAPARAVHPPLWAPLGRRLARALVRRVDHPGSRSLLLSPHEAQALRRREQRLGENRAARVRAVEARLAARDARLREKAERLRQKRLAKDQERERTSALAAPRVRID